MWIKKVAATPLDAIAKVIDSIAEQANEHRNAPSIYAVRAGLNDVKNSIPEVKDSLAETLGDTTKAPSIHATRSGINAVNSALNAACEAIDGEKADNDIIADEYSNMDTYFVGDYCMYNGTPYRCTTAITTPEDFNLSHWGGVIIASEIENVRNATVSNANQINTNKNNIGTLANLETSAKDSLVSAINEVAGFTGHAVRIEQPVTIPGQMTAGVMIQWDKDYPFAVSVNNTTNSTVISISSWYVSGGYLWINMYNPSVQSFNGNVTFNIIY